VREIAAARGELRGAGERGRKHKEEDRLEPLLSHRSIFGVVETESRKAIPGWEKERFEAEGDDQPGARKQIRLRVLPK